MSISSEGAIAQEDVARVLEMASEPSYISEIARKLVLADPAWDTEEITAIGKVSSVVSMIKDRDDLLIYDIEYGSDEMGQSESSPKKTLVTDDEGGSVIWEGYTLVYNTGDPDIRDEYEEYVDPSIDPIDKIEVIENLSSIGNKISKQAEDIMQDVMDRQFRHYEEKETPDYNDPGLDFYVEDEMNREWGLAVEVSVRYVNPIDRPYLEAKKEKADELDADLLIIAPSFTDELLDEYEDPDNPMRHSDPLKDIVHLHRVPPDEPTVYYPFAKNPEEIREQNDSGNPIIVEDSIDAEERLSELGNVGDAYPVVDSSYDDFVHGVGSVHREHIIVTESQYRNALREALEPLLWEFLRPYKIEQYLVHTYWDYGLTQDEAGKLVDRTGGTIGKWMREWGIMRRGSGAPELSDDVVGIWSDMYRGEGPFDEQFSIYRILAEYNRHPLWDSDDWSEWYQESTDDERKAIMARKDSADDLLGYTLMFGPENRLQPSYSFVRNALSENGVEIREPDEAPRVPYSAYPSRKALEYMINKNQDTIVDVTEEGE